MGRVGVDTIPHQRGHSSYRPRGYPPSTLLLGLRSFTCYQACTPLHAVYSGYHAPPLPHTL